MPDATRIIAPYLGGWLISFYGGDNLAVVNAMRLCYGISVIIGIIIALLRMKYLQETITNKDTAVEGNNIGFTQILREAYIGMIDSIKWMNRSLRIIVLVEIVTALSVSLTGPFWIVYATGIIGLTAYDFGIILTISGVFGVATAYPIGVLIDKFGARRMILASLVLGAVFPLLYILVPDYIGGFLGVTLVVCGVALVNNISMPAFATIIANPDPKKLERETLRPLGRKRDNDSHRAILGWRIPIIPFRRRWSLSGRIYVPS
ncbi:MFS transporter [Candidatus Bathyarchaeota archaeon]|nr:MFS transporter [Candidatus Bathyarchaeota archaeon]MBS7630700.1 MFS transporter [Candidatus Bathyarchaeota archaeon]